MLLYGGLQRRSFELYLSPCTLSSFRDGFEQRWVLGTSSSSMQSCPASLEEALPCASFASLIQLQSPESWPQKTQQLQGAPSALACAWPSAPCAPSAITFRHGNTILLVVKTTTILAAVVVRRLLLRSLLSVRPQAATPRKPSDMATTPASPCVRNGRASRPFAPLPHRLDAPPRKRTRRRSKRTQRPHRK